jgi:amidase
MTRGPVYPSIDEILNLAAEFKMELSADEAQVYRAGMIGALKTYRRIEELPELRPEVKYPRTPGYRPAPDENPYKAWYWRTDIPGADKSPLHGEKIGLKDVISVAGVPMMNGAPVLEGYIPDTDATVTTRILDAGATIVGKTASSDHSFSSGGHTSAYGPVRNPRKPTHSPGGSSKGSAAAIAAGDIDISLGGDQGGSVRIPASWFDIVALKPTYGLVPYTGCLMIEMTLDHIGPMANNVTNIARMMNVVAGPDPLDPHQRGVSAPEIDYTAALGKDIKGMRIAVVKEGFGQTAETWADIVLPPGDPVVDRKVRAAIAALEQRGAVVTEVSVPMHITAMHIWYPIFLEGATKFMLKGNGIGTNWKGYYNTQLADVYGRGWRSRPDALPHGVKTTLLLGEYMHRKYHGRYYAKAQNLRHLVNQAFDEVLESYDAMVMPTTVIRAQPIPDPDCDLEEWIAATLRMIHNCPQTNLSGHPAISVPCGMEDDLPIGMMIIGKHFDDATVIRIADAFERIGDWKDM